MQKAARQERAVRLRHRALLRGGLLRGPRRAEHPARASAPARQRAHPGDDRARRGAAREGPRLRSRRQRLLRHRQVPRLRPALRQPAGGSGGGRGRAADRRDARREAQPGRLRALEDRPDARHAVGLALGPRLPGLAHRVLGDVAQVPRATRSTSTPAARTTSSRTTSARSRRSRPITGKPFARYWMHTRHLLVDGQKMSKSLGNFYTVRDLVKRASTRSRSAICSSRRTTARRRTSPRKV